MTNLIGISGKIRSGKDTIGKIIQILTYCKDMGFTSPRSFQYQWDKDDYLKYPNGFQIKKFAYKLKQVVSILTGIRVDDLEREDIKNSMLPDEWQRWVNEEERLIGEGEEKTYRWLLQKVGTEAMRNIIHPNIWINALFADYMTGEQFRSAKIRAGRIAPLTSFEPCKWIITDTRFVNEAEAIKKRGGILIRVNREDNSNKEGFILKTRNSGNKLMVHQDNHASETGLDNWKDWNYVIDNSGTIEELVIKVKEILIKEKII